MVEQTALQVALVRIVAEGEKTEVAEIFCDVPREVKLRRGQSTVEVGNGFPLQVQPPGFDLMDKNVATSSVLNGRFGVPDAGQDTGVVAPRNLCIASSCQAFACARRYFRLRGENQNGFVFLEISADVVFFTLRDPETWGAYVSWKRAGSRSPALPDPVAAMYPERNP